MRKTLPSLVVLLIVVVFCQSLAVYAQDKEKNFYGNFSFGYRAVDTSGAYDKYREHINLEKGVRLFNLNLSYLSGDELKKLFDRIDLNVYNFGGDPFETFRLSIQKFGMYKFQYDRKKSDYFYHDQIGSLGFADLHSYNFTRLSDSGSFTAMLSKNFNLFLNFDRTTKTGSSITTFDLNRLEAETDKPLSEKLIEVAFGLDVHINRYSLVFEERIQDYKNSNSLFLPGAINGGDAATYPTTLDYFRLSQPYDFKSNCHTFRLSARPIDNLLIRGAAQLSKQDTNLTYSEEAAGIDYLDRSFSYAVGGQGRFTRKIQLYDFDLTYFLFNRIAVVGAVRSNDFKQDGSLTIGGEQEAADFAFNTLGIEAGLQYQLTSRFTLTVGYRNEQRKLTNLETATYADKTVRNGLFGNLKWDVKNVKLTMDYQHGNFDDPFTLISPTLFDRFRATAKYQIKGFSVSASYLLNKTKNEIPGGVEFRILLTPDSYSDLFTASNSQFNLRLGYNAARINASFGYSRIDFKSDSNRLVNFDPYWTGPGGTFPWAIHYEGKSSLWDASVAYDFERSWKIGGYFGSFKNTGFWPLDRTILKAYVEYTFPGGYATQVAYRYVNFKEKDSGSNDYKANILEFSFGYRWE